MERDRVIGYVAAMTDQEATALWAEARNPAAPAPITPGDTASVRRSLAAAAQAMWETPRDHNGVIGSMAAAAAARQPQPVQQPQPNAKTPQPPPDTGYTGSDSLRRTPFVTPATTHNPR